MITENKDLMKQARETLEGNWGLPIGVAVVYMLIVGTPSIVPLFGSAITLLIGAPMVLGFARFFLNFSRGQQADFNVLFSGFNNFGTALVTYLLMVIFVMLWMLLLIVPGIIASIGYSQTFFILAEDPTIAPMAALRKSKEMMYGYKWKYFCLNCRFIGWGLLCILTLGIGFIFLLPYMQVSYAKFHDDLRANYVEVVQ